MGFRVIAGGTHPDHSTISEFRVSAGHRYTANFVPQKQLASDADTLLLYHFDEGAGATTAEANGKAALALPAGVTWSKTCP